MLLSWLRLVLLSLKRWLSGVRGAVDQYSVKEQVMQKTASTLRLLPPESAHQVGLWCLSQRHICNLIPAMGGSRMDLSIDVPSIGRIRHPIGLAAGFDKNGVALTGLSRLGFSMIEIGTITPRAQRGHPKPRMFRYPDTRDLINRMGFPSDGVDAVAVQLREHYRVSHNSYVLGINVGKNHDTPLDHSLDDYLMTLERLKAWGDYFVINISSPNTQGLRTLAHPQFFKDLALRLGALESGLVRKTWIKLDPDLPRQEFQALIQAIADESFGGVVLTNTRKITFPEVGGLSGHSLRSFALQRLMWAQHVHNNELGIIAVGGITSGADVLESIRLGAHGVGIYSSLVFRGPMVVQKIITEIEGLMAARAMVHLEDARLAEYGDFAVESADDWL